MTLLITVLGPNTRFFEDAFFGPLNGLDITVNSATTTQVVTTQPETGHVTTFTGTGFTFDALGNITGGTITGLSFNDGVTTGVVLTGMSWSAVAFQSALVAADSGDYTQVDAMLSLQPVTVDGSASTAGIDDITLSGVTSAVSIAGSALNDLIGGGLGDDTITPGTNTGYDVIVGSLGNDTIDFAGANFASYYEIRYVHEGLDVVANAITVDINGNTNTGSISTVGGLTTVLNINSALHSDGLGIRGTGFADTFNIDSGAGGWSQYAGMKGNDTFNITLTGTVRISYSDWDGASLPTQGVNVNLVTGVVSNDGWGNVDQINVLGGTGILAIRGTDHNDTILGSDGNERFILRAGTDTLDAGGGIDEVRYDRYGVGAVTIDLAAQTGTGNWNGLAFNHTLVNVENLRGSRSGNDTLLGNDVINVIRGRGGDDNIQGRGGNDSLYGEDGNDTIIGGTGKDNLYGGNGDDILDASVGDATTEGPGDYIRPGAGTNTIIGNQALWLSGQGIDVSYGDVAGSGGVTINVDQNGTGTTVSNTAGVVNDTFTYAHHFEGTAQADTLVSTHTSGWRGWSGFAGNDTITGGAGIDELRYNWDWQEGGTNGITAIFTALGAGTVTDTFGDTDTFTGIERILGTQYVDVMTGHDGDNRFRGGAGNDILNGGGGNDRLNGGLGNDRLDGGAGFDTADYQDATGGVQVYLSPGKSRGADGYDRLTSIEEVRGSGFDDRLVGDGNTNTLWGMDGNDVLKTKGGNDTVYGGNGNDKIIGFDGDETFFGGNGNDILIGNKGVDTLSGGTGDDFLYGGQGNDTVNGDAGNDVLRGNLGNDLVNGGDGSDRIYGGGSNDTINGDAGVDYLYGENGNDILNGGAGNDSMTGGAGLDTFVFEAMATANVDKVKDFTNGDDKLDLSSFGFGSFADVQALTTDAGWALKLNFGGSNLLYLEGFALADFDVSDVIL